MKPSLWTLCVALAFGSVLPCGLSQSTAPVSPSTSDRTTGIVEAVIGNGDLKPARFAQIIAVPASLATDIKAAVSTMADAVEKARAGAKSGPETNLIEAQCVAAMLQVRPAITRLSEVGHANPQSGVISTEADELGEFSLTALRDDTYVIFATGKIGMNAAIWLVDIAPSARSERIKLVRPQLACYDPNGLYKP